MKTRGILVVSSVVVLVVLFASYCVFSDHVDQSDGFIILHTNDTHCYYGEKGALGFSTLKALKDQKEVEGNTVFVIDAGDFLQGNANGTITEGEASVEVMNVVGYDVGIPGNHDFDFSFQTMMERISELDYPIICSNLVYGSTGEDVFQEYIVLEKGGIRLGCFGLLTPDTKNTTMAGNMGDTVVTDPIEASECMVALLQTMDVDYIVAIGHIGITTSATITSDYICHNVPGIDIFVDGHSHTEMEDGRICDGSRELLESDTVIVSTGAYNRTVGVVTVEKDGTIDAKLYRGEKMNDETVDAVIDKVMEAIQELCGQKVGETAIWLDGERKDVRTKETNLCNLFADSMRIMTNSDAALVNGGDIRKSIDIGDITLGDVYDVNPFHNDVLIVTATGQNIRDAMEFSLSHHGTMFGGYLHISGFEVTWDPSKDSGSRIISMTKDGEEMSMSATYTVAMTDFLATGGDGNEAFVGLDRVVDVDQVQMVISYLEYVGTITQDTIQMGRVVQIERAKPSA